MSLAILVNSQDRLVGYMDKVAVHRGNALRHRAISVFLFNSEGKLLIQQRSVKKIVGALQWANTCCGNVLKGENRKQCAKRRLREELGITGVSLQKIGQFEYHTRCNDEFSEWEVDGVYVGTYEGSVVPNLQEVQATEWVDPKKFYADVLSGDTTYAPWVREIILKTPVAVFAK